MQSDYLRYFIDVAALGSMSSAAKKNHMTPQGISRSISALESELGCELFQRDSNKVMLTRIGEEVLGYARQLVNMEQDMRLAVVELQSKRVEKKKTYFTCYGSPVFFDTPLLFPISGLASAHYGSARFIQRDTADVVKLLVKAARSTRADIVTVGGLGFSDLFPDASARFLQELLNSGFEYRPFMHTNDYVLVPEYSPLARARALSADDLHSYRMAVPTDDEMERAITKRFGSERLYVAASDSAFRMRLARLGEALTLVPGFSLAFSLPEGTVAVPLSDPYTLEIGFASRKAAFEDGMLADIIERLTAFYGQHEKAGTYRLLDASQENSLFL